MDAENGGCTGPEAPVNAEDTTFKKVYEKAGRIWLRFP